MARLRIEGETGRRKRLNGAGNETPWPAHGATSQRNHSSGRGTEVRVHQPSVGSKRRERKQEEMEGVYDAP